MRISGLRSPHETVGGLVHFGRMLDKIKLHAHGKLPPDYHQALGGGFDGRCCNFLAVKYEDVVARVKLGGEDQDILDIPKGGPIMVIERLAVSLQEQKVEWRVSRVRSGDLVYAVTLN